MKISLEWLTDFLDFKEKNPLKIADKLTESSAEIDGVIDTAENFKNIVIGEILEIKPHPDADKLQITITKADKERSIICGAKNIKPGQKIPVALPGAKIGDFTIEKRKMRGVMSEGMLCSERELGISDEHEGIMILSEDAEINQDFAEHLGLKDYVLDVDNTAITNRADLFAHYGFARELVANGLASWKKGMENHMQDLESETKNTPKKDLSFDINIVNGELCPRWCGIEVENVNIAPSPDWMQKRLNACGIRPINNIVDATNYVMLALGMPMHAFDRDKINGKKLVMREAKKGEKMATLDGKMHEMPEGAIVFEDEKELFDLCGLMGGKSSEVSDDTKNLLVHAPVYDPVKIRRTALKLDHRTDAAIIYEKGVPVSSAMAGLMRTVELILRMCPEAKIASSAKDIKNYSKESRKIKLKKSLIERMLGVKVEDKEIENILSSLGFIAHKEADSWEVEVPRFRFSDVKIPEDLAEEVVRIYGLNRVEAVPPLATMQKTERNSKKLISDKIADVLVDHNFYEILNFSFLGSELLKRCGLSQNDQTIEIKNPLSADQSLMRQSLFPRILENAEKNSRYQDSFRIFECAKTFTLEGKDKKEYMHLCGLMLDEDFYSAKGIAEVVLRSLNHKAQFKEAKVVKPFLNKSKTADLIVQGKRIGFVSELSPKIAKEFSLKDPVAILKFDIDILSELKVVNKTYKKLPRYPGIFYDISVLASSKTQSAEVLSKVKNLDNLIKSAEIIEIFEGKGVPEGKKSVTISFEFRSDERTLEEKEVKVVEDKIISALQKAGIEKRFA